MIENLLDATRLLGGGLSIKMTDICLPDMARRPAERFQVLSNLISNAIKFSTDGEIKINGQVRADNVIVCVSDQGPGIAPDDMPHISNRFYRTPKVAKKTKLAGLGLFLSKPIVEPYGGRTVIEEPDIDTCGVKLLALAEKMPVMRGRILASEEIVNLFQFPSVQVQVLRKDATVWIVIQKAQEP